MAKKPAPETKLCKHCQSEIPYKAKVCPNCRKKVKGGKLKWVLLILALFIVYAIVSGGDDTPKTPQKVGTVGDTSSSSSEAGSQQNETPEDAPETEVQAEYHVGDILMDGEMKIVYAGSGVYKEDNEFSQPEDGYQYIFLKLAFENTSEKTDHSISSFSFECYADGYACDSYYGGEEDLSATLSAGRSTMGYLYFTVPEDAKDIVVEYETNFFTSEKIPFVYDGDKDSGYELEKNTEAAADAFHVGDVVEAGELTIKYLGCSTYESDNPFIQPAKGAHFIRVDFEFENTADSNHDEYVTTGDFDCFADGISCKQEYLVDDLLSATISAGHKAKGSVFFEVPDDAETVEVEYLTNLWTSNRIVFAYSK